jgi:hypothetical protein
MRVHLIAALILTSSLLTSCADMPTAPRAMVSVSGTILDRDGKGMQAVYVFFYDLGPAPKGTYGAGYRAVTNIDGKYSRPIPEGRYEIIVSPPAFSAYAPTLIRSEEIGRAGLQLDFKFDLPRIAIRPSIAGGQPVSALRAEVWPDFSLGFIWDRDLRLAGDEREAFVPPGSYSLHMELSGIGFGYLGQDLWDVTVSADTTINVSFSGNAVVLHVTGQDAQPLANAKVFASGGLGSATARTDATGSATLYIPTGTYRLTALGAFADVLGRELTDVPIAGGASFDFGLSGTVWTGVVRRTGSGIPVEGAFVRVLPENPSHLSAVSTTDAEGSFHVVVETGKYYEVWVHELVGGDAYAQVARIDSVAAGADSTFDITANSPSVASPSLKRPTPTPPAGPGAPASAAVDPASRRRNSRTAE